MNRLKKYISQIHKTLGSVLSLMFVVWFISGIVLIFQGFTHASLEERFLHLPEFNADQFKGLQPPSSDFEGDVALDICDGKPVYRVYSGRKAQKVYDAATLAPITTFSEDFAIKLSESFNGYPVRQVTKMNDFDQWIPWSYYKPLFPVYKCYMDDPKHTVLYVSEKSGEIVQETDRVERWCARFGAIPHWMYFKKLQLQQGARKTVVIVLSVFGMLVSISGIYMGIVRFRNRKSKKITPYKKFWYKWHHLLGFFFGLFVFTFILSGFISVTNVPDWMAGVKSSEKERIVWDEDLELNGHNNTTPELIFDALNRKTGIRKIEWKTAFNQPQFRVYYNDYQIPEVYCLQKGKVEPFQELSIDEVENHAKKVLKDIHFNISVQPAYDNYYSASAMHYLPEPAYKIEIDDEAATWLYIDPANGDEVTRHTKNSRVRRWIYRFLHSFDIPFLKKHEWLRKSILVFLSILGLGISISGFVLTVRRVKRKTKNIK